MIKHWGQKLRGWRKSSPRNSEVNIRVLEDQLDRVGEEAFFYANMYKEVERNLRGAILEEEEYWRNKSRVEWLKKGDWNTAYFHARVTQRRVQNRIHGLEDEMGVWNEGDLEVRGIILRYFGSIFSSGGSTHFDEILRCVGRRVSGL